VGFWLAVCILLQVYQPDWAFPYKPYNDCVDEKMALHISGMFSVGTTAEDIERYCCEEQNMSWVGQICTNFRS